MPESKPSLDLPKPRSQSSKGKAKTPFVYWLAYLAVSCGLLFTLAAGVAPALQTAADAGCRAMRPRAAEGPAPSLVFEDLQGNRVNPSEVGPFRVVNFWATWCEPCLDEWPDLDRLANRLAGQDNVEVWAVSIDEDREAVRKFIKAQGLEDTRVRILFDASLKGHEAFGSDKIPDTYFVDGQGQIQSVFVNVREWGKPEAQRCVEAAAARAAKR